MNQELVPYESHAPAKLFEGGPQGIIAAASETATALAKVIDAKRLYATIQGRKHVTVEGWTLLGTLVGVFPVCAWSRALPDGSGWEARVEARTLDGKVVGAAEAECLRSERTWSNRDDYALRSMAQTRATSKALRLPLGFVVTLAGYDPTPAEEMPSTESSPLQQRQSNPQRQQPRRQPARNSDDKAGSDFLDAVDAEYKEIDLRDTAFDAEFGVPQQLGFDVERWRTLFKAQGLAINDFRAELGVTADAPNRAGWQTACDGWVLAHPDLIAACGGDAELALTTKVLEAMRR